MSSYIHISVLVQGGAITSLRAGGHRVKYRNVAQAEKLPAKPTKLTPPLYSNIATTTNLMCDATKNGSVKPFHKSGNKKYITHYRPISITSTVCKLLENIIHKHISEFLEKHDILTEHQHGFRRFSTCTQRV